MDQSFDFTSYNNIKRLSEEELTALWGEYFKDKTQKSARDALIVQYIYLIRYVVGRVKVTLPSSISVEDIAGYGVEGLINAIERAQDFLPRSVRKKIKDIKNAQEQLKQELGRTPTTTEVAHLLEMDPEKVNQLLSEDTTMTSIYEKRGSSEDSMEIIDTIQDTNKLNPQEQMEEKNVKQQLEKALRRLPERERVIMVLYYQENMTLKEIGQTLNMSESRVCQLHAQSIMKLKNILNEDRSSRMRQSIIA